MELSACSLRALSLPFSRSAPRYLLIFLTFPLSRKGLRSCATAQEMRHISCGVAARSQKRYISGAVGDKSQLVGIDCDTSAVHGHELVHHLRQRVEHALG